MVRPIRPSEFNSKRNIKTGIRVKNSRTSKSCFYLSGRQIVLIAVMFLLFMSSSIGYVWSNYEGTQKGFDLTRLKQKELDLKERNLKLKVELATLQYPQNLEAAARRLGLKSASPEQIIILR